MRKELQHIKLHVYDTDIDISVDRNEEPLYREAAKLITERYGIYKMLYEKTKGDHEIALMTMVEIALQLQRQLHRNDTAPLVTMISQMTSEIEDALKKSETDNI